MEKGPIETKETRLLEVKAPGIMARKSWPWPLSKLVFKTDWCHLGSNLL